MVEFYLDPDTVLLFVGTTLISACVLLLSCGTCIFIVLLMRAGALPMLCCIRRCQSNDIWSEVHAHDLESFLSNEERNTQIDDMFRD
jgi:hypothetical protein